MAKTPPPQKRRLGRGLASLMEPKRTEVEPEARKAAEPTRDGAGETPAGKAPAGEPPAGAPSAREAAAVREQAPTGGRSAQAGGGSLAGRAAPPAAPRATEGAAASGVLEVPVEAIRPNPHQPRRSFDEARLAELAESLKANGLIQPVVLRGAPGGEGYQLIAGERRLRAARLAGLATVPAVVRDVDSLTQAQLALVENIQREDLNPLDRAEGYQALIEQLGLTQAELAGRLGEDRATVANHLRLLKLAGPVQQLVRDGKLSLGHAKVLAGLEDPEAQVRLAQLVVSQSLSVRNLERKLAEGTPVAPRRAEPAEHHLRDLEGRLTRQLGMKVKLAGGNGGRGRITIAYANLDQFDALCERLGVLADEG